MNDHDMERLTREASSLSEKMRLLHDAGVPKGEIARFLKRRYQHVYNVIKDYETRTRGADGDGQSGETPAHADVIRLTLGPGGSVQLPAEWLEGQGLSHGDTIICRTEARGLLVMSRAAATELLRETARKRMPDESALLDALLGGQTEKQ